MLDAQISIDLRLIGIDPLRHHILDRNHVTTHTRLHHCIAYRHGSRALDDVHLRRPSICDRVPEVSILWCYDLPIDLWTLELISAKTVTTEQLRCCIVECEVWNKIQNPVSLNSRTRHVQHQ